MSKHLLSAALATVIVASLIQTAQAAAPNPVTSTFQVKLTINKACTVSTSGALDLGSADSNSATDVTANASNISVTCSKKTPYTVGLTPSSSNTDGTGTMKGVIAGNTDTVAYALYQNAANTAAWGNVAGTNTLTAANGLAVGTGAAQTYKVYGKVLAANLNVTPDAYADTVTVTVSY